MLNKKSIFNFIYALSLISLVTTCIGLLNELIEIFQRSSVNIKNAKYGEDEWLVLFLFYFIVFSISTFITIIKILKFANVIKWRCVNILGIIGCTLSLILSFVMIYVLASSALSMQYSYYLPYYTLHTAAFSFFAYFGITLVCDLINKRYSKRNDSEENS